MRIFRAAGLSVRTLGVREQSLMHHKFAIFDERPIVVAAMSLAPWVADRDNTRVRRPPRGRGLEFRGDPRAASRTAHDLVPSRRGRASPRFAAISRPESGLTTVKTPPRAPVSGAPSSLWSRPISMPVKSRTRVTSTSAPCWKNVLPGSGNCTATTTPSSFLVHRINEPVPCCEEKNPITDRPASGISLEIFQT